MGGNWSYGGKPCFTQTPCTVVVAQRFLRCGLGTCRSATGVPSRFLWAGSLRVRGAVLCLGLFTNSNDNTNNGPCTERLLVLDTLLSTL